MNFPLSPLIFYVLLSRKILRGASKTNFSLYSHYKSNLVYHLFNFRIGLIQFVQANYHSNQFSKYLSTYPVQFEARIRFLGKRRKLLLKKKESVAEQHHLLTGSQTLSRVKVFLLALFLTENFSVTCLR